MPLHILQLGPYPPPEGGVTHNILAIRDEAIRRGHECSIIATARSSANRIEPNVYHPRSPSQLIRTMRALDCDLVHLHVGGDITRRVMALAYASTLFGPKKSVLTVHSGAYPLTEQAKAASPASVSGRIMQRFSHLIGVNDALAGVFRRYGVTDERISVIAPYALRKPDDGIEIPEELDSFCANHSPLLVTVGGLEPEYQVAIQITAMNEVLAKFPGAGLLIIGEGSIRRDIETTIAGSDHSKSIYLAGNIQHSITLHMISRADALLRTTKYDGDAISVREALYLGTPVVATDVGSRPDGVRLIGIDDNEELASAVIEVIDNGKPNGRAHDADGSNIAEIVDLYERLVSS